jgi:hypothetical protein
MRKNLFWLVVAVFVIVVVVGAGILVLHFENKYPAGGEAIQGVKGATAKIPTGSQTYNISQAPGTLPVISQVTIDPVVVGVGDIQKFVVITRNDPSDPVISVEAITVTDHGTSTVLLTPTTTTSTAPGVQTFAGQWKVHDTHTAKYATTFWAKDKKGNQNSITLSWMDPTCDSPLINEDMGGGTYILNACNFGSPGNQIEEGNILIKGTVTMNSPATLAFSPGYQINFASGASLAIATGASITTTNSTGAFLPVAPPPIAMNFDGSGADMMVYPQTPTNEDFKIKVCMNSSGGNTACETSPWASQEIANTGQWIDSSTGDGTYYVSPGTSALGTGGWSGWDWPGGNDQLSSSYASVSIVATTTLPAGEALNNLQLAIELWENNNAYGQGYIGSNINLPNETLGCKISYSPVAGGSGTEVYSYTYENSCPGTGSAASTPDVFRVSMIGSLVTQGSLRSATLSESGIPTSITHGTSVSGATITVTNNGPMALVSNSQTFWGNATGTGDCYTDTDGDGILDTPNPNDSVWDGIYGDVPPTISCAVPGTLTANDIQLSHIGSFVESTPANMAVSTTKTTTYRGSYTAEVGTGCAMNKTNNFFAFIMGVINKAFASVIGGCSYNYFPAMTSKTYSSSLGVAVNGNYTFTLPTMTAPNVPGTYTERWIVADGNSSKWGKITNGSYSQTITVN